MTTKLTCFCIAFILFSDILEVLSIKKGYYTIIVPQSVPYDSIYHVSITLNDFHKSCWFNISLSSERYTKELNQIEGLEIKPGTTKLIELKAPSENYKEIANLNFFGYRGIIHEETSLILFYPPKIWAFIQTNKYKYKPGELVKYRVIFIDQLKRPAKVLNNNNNEILTIDIYDHEDNLIKSVTDVELVKGVFRSEFQLSDYPILGIWIIKARIGYRQLAERIFEVDRYELSEFYVEVINKNDVAYEEDQIALDIYARYFYGEPVKGNVSILISDSRSFELSRKIQIYGHATIILNFKNDLKIIKNISNEYQNFPHRFYVEVQFTDALSEEQFYTLSQFEVHSQPYAIELKVPNYIVFEPILNIKVKALLKDIMGNSITDTKSSIQIFVQCGQESNPNVFDNFQFEYKNETGKDFAIIRITNKNYDDCYLHAEYPRSLKTFRYWMSIQKFGLNLDILTESPEEGKELEIKITSLEPIFEFSYEIQSRDDIIQSDHVNVPGNETTYILRLDVTFAMVPKITIYIHHIQNMEFSGAFKDITVKRASYNSIKIDTENETKPGSLTSINVTTDEASYVGLMGIDRSTLANINKNTILNGNVVNNQLRVVNGLRYPYINPMNGGYTGDIVVLSNIFKPTRRVLPYADFPTRRFRTRRLFPESWLYIDFERTPAGGLKLLETVPDSITTWVIDGFSIHPDTGLTFTENATNLKVFQEFFVSFDFPNFLRVGEIVEVPIYISNYLDTDIETLVTIDCNSEELKILESPDANQSSKFNISKLIPSKTRKKFPLFLKPIRQGSYNVTVTAVSPLANDAVEKTLTVQSEGISYALSKIYLIHLPKETTKEDDITIDIPQNAIPESQRIEVSVVGDIFRPLMEKFQQLTKVPYGNGEDNIKLIVSNSIVLKYLKTLKYSYPSLEKKIRFNLELGYQNQLPFNYLDGSFGLVERTIARTGDIWQTVLALWGLHLAKDFVYIDPKVINRGLEYLQSKQQENGCYKSEAGLEEDIKFTAFGLIVFLMDENSRETYSDVIVKGFEFLIENSYDLEYSPISVMSAYVLHLGNHQKSADFLAKLKTASRLKSNQKQWTKADTLQSYLETTAESLINLFENQEIPEQGLLHIVKGLILPSQRGDSVTHMLALQAMIRFVNQLMLNNRNDLNINVNDNQNKSGVYQLNSKNSQLLQTFEVARSSRKLNIQSKGQGYAVVDVKYKYNLIPETKSSSIYSTKTSTKKTSNNLGILKVCLEVANNKSDNAKSKLKLTKMDVNLQSGYIFDEKEFPIVKKLNDKIKSVQISNDRDKVSIYINNTLNACIELDIRKTYKVLNSKPGWIIVNDALEKDEETITEFLVTEI